jgi:hypothetical protein
MTTRSETRRQRQTELSNVLTNQRIFQYSTKTLEQLLAEREIDAAAKDTVDNFSWSAWAYVLTPEVLAEEVKKNGKDSKYIVEQAKYVFN